MQGRFRKSCSRVLLLEHRPPPRKVYQRRPGNRFCLQDSEDTEHGLQLLDAPSMQEPRGGFADLREEEKKRLLTVTASLRLEIGMKSFYTFDIRTCREDVKKLVHTFFSRYRQTESEDHYLETVVLVENNQRRFASTLNTPSFYQRSFRGHPMLLRILAETSAYRKFLEDPDAREVSRWLPPPSRVLRRHILGMFNKDWKEDMLLRGISPKLVQQEAIQELSDKLRSLGCRLAKVGLISYHWPRAKLGKCLQLAPGASELRIVWRCVASAAKRSSKFESCREGLFGFHFPACLALSGRCVSRGGPSGRQLPSGACQCFRASICAERLSPRRHV